MEKIKVLLVEDEPTLAMIIKDTLDGNEFDITLAANGEEGLSRYAEIKPDIIVADIMMPKMDGITVLKKIRAEGNKVPVLILTAKSDVDDRVLGLDSGADDYLASLFSAKELLARIRSVTRRNTEAVSSVLSFGNLPWTVQALCFPVLPVPAVCQIRSFR